MSCRTYIVVGCRSLDVFKRTFKKNSIRKYDEDTGKPYMWEKKDEYWIIFGKEFPVGMPLEGAVKYGFCLDLQVFDKYSHDSDDPPYNPRDSVLIGFKAFEIDPHGSDFVEIDSNRLSELSTRFFNATGVKASVFMIQETSK